ncbi:hypothetical protein DMC30DRAFT_354596 [Rhodotorula diobovata]|uniref:DUF7729 domain-containing protein n=1 Tax=Rhodotorula diobovata TaxID=5288 RepID=A0A5C5FTA0_9BASI|nr:hypothetical protein DMC30DRAFT_354596 [Rhodotorula diobovata]
MLFASPTAALAAAAALALAGVHPANAQGASSSSSASSASASARSSSNSTGAPTRSTLLSPTATLLTLAPSSAASSTSTSASPASTNNPLIPSAISTKCQSFLTYLNSHPDVAACTAPLLQAVSAFHASASSDSFDAASSSAIQDALAGLCYSSPCDDALVRSLLTQFNSDCSDELANANSVVLGSYDALYVLTPLRDAVCSTDSAADWCINDIAKGEMPAGSMGANATAVVSNVASSYAAAATASIDLASSASPSPSPSSSNASAPASASASSSSNDTAPAFNLTAPVVQSVPSFSVPSILPNAATWSTTSLPFLFLSPNMSSSLLCSSCTKSILSAYVAWESRMPYALGLANSPLLSGQGDLWTATGEKCGGGFLESVAKQAGEANLTGGAAPPAGAVAHAAVVGAVVLAALALVA